jgi:ribonuclease HI
MFMEQGKLLNVTIYTDGACSGNPGPGGWAALLLIKSVNGKKKEKVVIKGGEKHTTNNRMEMVAVIESLKFIYKNLKDYKFQVKVFCDSAYVVDSVNNGSLFNWQRNGWKTTKNTDVSNKDLWEKLVKLDNKLSPSFIKVKGHSDNKFNNYVDEIAVKERDKYKRILNKL